MPLKGISRPVEILRLAWRDGFLFPHAVVIEQTQLTVALPDQDLITLGRLPHVDGVQANDIILALPDARLTQQLSRWHIELRRGRDGLILRSVTDAITEVDGEPIGKGEERPVHAGSIVVLGRVMTLRFIGDETNPLQENRTFGHT